SNAGSQYTPCTGPVAIHVSSWSFNASAFSVSLRRRTSTPIVCSRCASASATPDLSGMITTRWPDPRVTPVDLQRASGGRKVGTGTRRGIRLVASELAWTGRTVVDGFEAKDAGTAHSSCAGACFCCVAAEVTGGALVKPG